MELLIVTGMSGAGKSAVVDALEDLGYFCADNLPPAIIPTIAQFVSKTDNAQKIATVTDIRVGEKMFNEFPSVLKNLEEQGYKYKVLFVDASEEVLVRRYKETRRKHPLLDKCDGSLHAAIAMEHEKLLNIRMKADYIIDTSKSSVAECKQRVNELFLDDPDSALKIRCMSFGFKYGIPNDADLVFDVRCLPNPFYVPSMKYRSGKTHLAHLFCDVVFEKFSEKAFFMETLSLSSVETADSRRIPRVPRYSGYRYAAFRFTYWTIIPRQALLPFQRGI